MLSLGEGEEVFVVEEVGGVGGAHERAMLGLRVDCLLEKIEEHASEGGDAQACGDEDVVVFVGELGGRAFAAGAGELDFVAWLGIAEVVAADAQEEFAGVPVFVNRAFDCGCDKRSAVLASGR